MHPAPSLILFSALSGLGFGLLAWLGVRHGPWPWWALGFALAGAGLLASTAHLRRPSRAVLAFSQWRTSWLSREAILALAALTVMGLAAALSTFAEPVAPLGWLGALLCLAAVLCTAMIYAQIRAVPRWRHWTTPALFLALAVAGGALLLGLRWAGLALLAGAAVLQVLNWRHGAGAFARLGATRAGATGLKGEVRSLAPPHTGPSYLTREVMFVVARRRAEQLRLLTLALGFALPALLLVLPYAWTLAAPVHLLGVLCSRWLFLAEAEHVTGLYYGVR